MVVQCTSCQARFRIADDKVTERGVRVRCTSCKNVFQVKKPGAADAGPAAPGPGSTMELSALDAAALARPAPRAAPAPGPPPRSPAPVRPATAPISPAGRPAPPPVPAVRPAPARPVARAPAAPSSARRLETDDLFGMSELTGDSPMSLENAIAPAARPAPPKAPPPRPAPIAKPAARPMPSFDDIELEVDDTPPPPPPPARAPASRRTRGPPRPPPSLEAPEEPAAPAPVEDDPFAAALAATPSPPPPPDDLFEEPAPPPPPEPAAPADEASAVKLGAFKTQLKDPFEGMNLGLEGTGAIELSTTPPPPPPKKPAAEKPAPPPPEPVREEPQVPYSASREVVSSALTGLVGAALAVSVVLGAAFSDDTSSGWLGFGAGGDIVATRVVSGLYDTAGSKPVFYVRGRVENRSKKQRGPVRVIAELVADSGVDAHAEAIAGAEPTPEAVFELRTPAEAEKLNRSLEQSDVERRVSPGGSLPFFAVIADPPGDLERHKLHVRVESVDAWVAPPGGKGPKGR